MASGGENPKLEGTKKMIRSVLMSVKEGVHASRFLSDYRGISGETIPYQQFGHSNLDSFIRSIPDVVMVRQVRGELTYFAVSDENTEHIQSLIARQKSAPKKSKSLKKGKSRFPRHHSQVSRAFFSRQGPPPGRPLRGPFMDQSRSFSTPLRSARPALLPTPVPFSSADVSPLTVTVSGASDRRMIQRKKGGEQQIATQAIKAATGQKPPTSNRSSYDMPPRFRRQQNTSDRPVAVVAPNPHREVAPQGPEVSEGELPGSVKTWAKNLLKSYMGGLWFSRFTVLYKEELNYEPPRNLLDLMQNWNDVVNIEWNTVTNKFVLYPVKESAVITETPPPTSHSPASPPRAPPSSTKSTWKTFNIPCAQLLEAGTDMYVFVAFVTDLGDFHVHREESNVSEIDEILASLCVELDSPSISDLEPGMFCAALYQQDASWYRARVLFVFPETREVQVMFVDYGNTGKVPISSVKSLPESVADMPSQAVPCKLYGLKPLDDKGWSQEAISKFGTLTPQDRRLRATTVLVEEGRCVVELFSAVDDDESAGSSVNCQLLDLKLVSTYLPRPPPPLDISKTDFAPVILSYVDLCKCWIRFEGEDYSEKLEVFEETLEGLYESGLQTAHLQQGCVCIVKSGDSYCRVQLEEVEGDEANCFFLDHGFRQRVPVEDLVLLDGSVNEKLAYQAVCCELYGLGNYWPDDIFVEELLRRSKDKILQADILILDPLTLMLYDTHGDDDVNINEEIAKRLKREKGYTIDMTQFTPSSADSGSERGSVATSPRPDTAHPDRGVTSEQLSKVTQRLTLTEGTQTEDGDLVNAGSGLGKAGSTNGPDSGVGNKNFSTTTTTGTASGTGIPAARAVADRLGTVGSSSVSMNSRQVANSSVLDSLTSVPASGAPQDFGDRLGVGPATAPSDRLSVSNGGGDANTSLASSSSAQTSLPPHKFDVSNTGSQPAKNPLNVTYDTWPLPKRLPAPNVQEFFIVSVQSVSDPSNFVVMRHGEKQKLEDLMMRLNIHFNLEMAQERGQDPSDVRQPVCVPDPVLTHLYMVCCDGVFYRAIFCKRTESLLHMLLVDYCQHILIEDTGLFFLPKPFWTLPFSAYRARLDGVKPAGTVNSGWSEAAKYEFTRLVFNRTLYAMVKGIKPGQGEGSQGGLVGELSQILALHLIDTSLPDRDVIVADSLLSGPHLGVVPDV